MASNATTAVDDGTSTTLQSGRRWRYWLLFSMLVFSALSHVLRSDTLFSIFHNPKGVVVKPAGTDHIDAAKEPRSKVTVHVYGGSIRFGGGLKKRFLSRYSAILQSLLQDEDVDVVVSNFAIPASGPEHWVLCGIDYSDIIISEFRINEWDIERLAQWYDLAKRSSQHLVILDLWSWLTPPGRPLNDSRTIKALQRSSLFKANDSGVSTLALDKMEQDSWQDLVPRYFNYSRDTQGIPQMCYDSIYMKTTKERSIMEKCSKLHANNMQHGTEFYHDHIARTLHNHFMKTVFRSKSSREDHRAVWLERSAICISQWGSASSFDKSWNSTIVHNTGFLIQNPFSDRRDKITLNTNSTFAQLQLDCPFPYNQSAKVGYIAHSDIEESGIARLNNATLSTLLINDKRPHVRIRQYSLSLTLPIHVFIEKLPIGQYIEFTGLICSSQKPS